MTWAIDRTGLCFIWLMLLILWIQQEAASCDASDLNNEQQLALHTASGHSLHLSSSIWFHSTHYGWCWLLAWLFCFSKLGCVQVFHWWLYLWRTSRLLQGGILHCCISTGKQLLREIHQPKTAHRLLTCGRIINIIKQMSCKDCFFRLHQLFDLLRHSFNHSSTDMHFS